MKEPHHQTVFNRDNQIPAEEYENSSRKFIPGYDGLYSLAEILLAERLPDEAEILIVGAGGGKEVVAFGKAFPDAHLTGVDPSAATLGAARELAARANLTSRVTLHRGTIDDLDEKAYDAATALLVMHFLPDNGEKLQFLQAIHRRLKPDARFIIADGCYDKNAAEFAWLFHAFKEHAAKNGATPQMIEQTTKFITESSQSISETRELELLREANFSEIKSFYQGLWFRAWAATRR